MLRRESLRRRAAVVTLRRRRIGALRRRTSIEPVKKCTMSERREREKEEHRFSDHE